MYVRMYVHRMVVCFLQCGFFYQQSQKKLWIRCDPAQDKVATEDK